MEQILRVNNLRKEYPGVVAVDGLTFGLNKGEAVALLGENGAGKSTTIKMISGVESPDNGEIVLNGVLCDFANPHEASESGIGVVFQELSLVGALSIAENIYMNRQPTNRYGLIDFNKLFEDAKEMLKIFELDLKPQMKVSQLSAGNKQIVEILKAISQNPKILILDEPTSSLSDVEINDLFQVIDRLKKEGMSFIYISHKLSEVFRLCEQAVVMRDGKFIASERMHELSEEKIVSLMVGRKISDLFGVNNLRQVTDLVKFKVDSFSKENEFDNIGFQVNEGEIIGIFGLIGSGRTELAESIVGFNTKDNGLLQLNGQQIKINNPRDAINFGIGYVTEDRKELGLYLNKTIEENLIVNNLTKFSNRGFLEDNKIADYATEKIKDYGVSAYSTQQEVGKLSGGNQQKILLAMWLELDPEVMIFDEPTRGVDIGAKSEIYSSIRDYTMKGKGTIIISSELPELMGLCDRILIMKNGLIVGEISKYEFSEEKIVGYATGVFR